MKKLQDHALMLDSFLSFMYKFNLIAAALLSVGFCVLWIVYLVSPESIHWNTINLNFGMIKFTVDPSIPHNPDTFISQLCAMSIFFLSYMIIWIMIIRCGRKILAPMVEGNPFHHQMADQLKHLGRLNIALGIVDNVGMYVRFGNHIAGCDLDMLFSNSAIIQYTTDYRWDFSFVYWTAILFLLSYVFKHGWELQQLSDETL